jgi:hypothetical protein
MPKVFSIARHLLSLSLLKTVRMAYRAKCKSTTGVSDKRVRGSNGLRPGHRFALHPNPSDASLGIVTDAGNLADQGVFCLP